MPPTTAGVRDRSAPRAWERRWRPVGYLAVALVWWVLTAITLTAVLYLAVAAALGVFPPLSQTLPEQLADPQEAVAFAICVPLLAALFGPLCWYLPTLCWPCAVLASVYVQRSLRPGYADERLSRTEHAVGTFGPATVTATALSLQPVRESRVTRAVMCAYVSAWSPRGRQLRATLPTGAAYLLFFGAHAWPTHGVVRWLLVAASAALLAVSVVGVVRETRRRFAAPAVPTGA
ncbi:hypothetical protein [Cellulomonas shaoxiangyii]|uniref:Uncharacterized protein n=1 Tax=Cellulomonas shaoxiangyii TaxID=2566013 RepID=A0A4P7SGF3_9CELL|nr:hypothetical protein [Cellulomonas shaoxiangyii]QCB92721.1 hypothetical protein E5225_03280 [Cellulomonas shaoxiangyii]TGY85847.1 hypothetical protein E5226_04725 [Cellulomonas shaoxiangyii]